MKAAVFLRLALALVPLCLCSCVINSLVKRRCIREIKFFGSTFGRDPVPQVDIVRSDSSRVRRRVAVTALDRLREDADGVRVFE